MNCTMMHGSANIKLCTGGQHFATNYPEPSSLQAVHYLHIVTAHI